MVNGALAVVTVLQLFRAGDAAFLGRADETRAREALATYRALFRRAPHDTDAAWRVAMGCYFVGLRLTADAAAKKELFAEGREAGLFAARAAPDCVPCHFWAAINMALYGETVGALKMLFSLGEIREHLVTVLRLDPAYAHAGAARLLGLIEQKLPGLLGGSRARARDYFLEAIRTAPDEPLNFLFMAELLGENRETREEAARWIRQGLEIRGLAPDRLESIEAQVALRGLLPKF